MPGLTYIPRLLPLQKNTEIKGLFLVTKTTNYGRGQGWEFMSPFLLEGASGFVTPFQLENYSCRPYGPEDGDVRDVGVQTNWGCVGDDLIQ